MTATTATTALTGTTKTYTPTSSASASADAKSSLTTTDASEQQDKFLKLLVAQMNNQDPMSPMDNAQMTSQIAQINTVSGIAQLNDTMKSMSTQMSAMQVLQAGNLVGHSVLVEGDKLAVSADGKTGAGGFDLAGKAADVQVQVLTTGGRVIDTLSMGALEAGQHSFQVDASAYPSGTPLRFQAVASNGTTAVTSTLLMQDKVMAVGSGTDGLTLTLQGNGVKSYSSVRSVL
ncbi:flagellar hook assembly protein FlgD [Variovorax sp. PvP013]|jgi:flagellar basal-body rod modification protein FlgD|uniref:flagellar hook assembly protein FlgD n=1 Tax=Variovorax sp. PvP013 TaxID=3156435 RepID=UPI003D204695